MSRTLRLEPWAGDAAGIAPADAHAAAETITVLTEHPRPARWGCHLARRGGEVVGIGAFKAPPDVQGTVEIAYRTLPTFERQGHATAIIAALVDLAREGGAAVVIAHTRPVLAPSARALLRNGFVQADAFDDPDDGPVWYWERVVTSGR